MEKPAKQVLTCLETSVKLYRARKCSKGGTNLITSEKKIFLVLCIPLTLKRSTQEKVIRPDCYKQTEIGAIT